MEQAGQVMGNPLSDPSERTLLIKGKGGLGNRILSAVSGLVFADLAGRRPVIDWRDGSYAPLGQNAYPLLFETPISLEADRFDHFDGAIDPPVWQGHLEKTPQAMIDRFAPDKHSSILGYRKFCTTLSRLDVPAELAVFWCYLPKFGRLTSHLGRDERFRGRPLRDIISDYLARYFTPRPHVLARVEDILKDREHPLIGVHIRYTDRKIPLGKIKSALRRNLRNKPGAPVFLATDNAAVQSEMMEEFPQVFIVPKALPNDGSRLHLPGTNPSKLRDAESALIDMWLLSRCDEMIYSRHSTFSVTSSYLGDFARTQLFDVDRFNLPVVAKRIIQNYA